MLGVMRKWIRKLLGAAGPVAAVMETLEAARADGRPIEVVSQSGDSGETVIEMLLDDAFVIGLPRQGDLGRPLGCSETVTIRLNGPRGLVSGRTRVLGRYRLRGADGAELLGYRVEYPAVLSIQPTRRDLERVFGADVVQEGTLRVMSSKVPIHGLVDEITPGHVVLICRNGTEHLQPNAEAVLHLALPGGGAVDEVVRVSEVDRRDGQCTVRVMFRARQAAIARAMRGAA